MRILLLSSLLLVTGPLMAFNVGPTSRSNFGSTNQAQEEMEEQSPQSPFSATKYNPNRWRKDTQAVSEEKAPMANMPVPEPVQPVMKENPVVTSPSSSSHSVKKVAVPEMTVKSFGKQIPEKKPEVVAPNNVQPMAQEPVIPAEATAAMEQLGQMQEMMKSLGGDAAGAGMPDFSALMGGAAKPAKK